MHRFIHLWIIALGVFLSGCITEIWDRYENPDYRSTRAEQLCHPYGACVQGTWVGREGIATDPKDAYYVCVEQYRQPRNTWSEGTVAQGLEVGRCMRAMGYRLAQR